MPTQSFLDLLLLFLAIATCQCAAAMPRIDRHAVVSRYNPTRDGSVLEPAMPLQIGNGNFAFGCGLDGLQTFQPWAALSSSSWAWKNDTLPPNRTAVDLENYHGTSWLNHGRPVVYEFGGEPKDVEQWLIMNPNRVNLGRVGFAFFDEATEEEIEMKAADLQNLAQMLDLWTGIVSTKFSVLGEPVSVQTSVHETESTISITVVTPLLSQGRLALFVDFPWTDGINKFAAPFVGSYDPANWTLHHTSILKASQTRGSATIAHSFDSFGNATFYTTITGSPFIVEEAAGHRYIVRPATKGRDFELTVHHSFDPPAPYNKWTTSAVAVHHSSKHSWEEYWTKSGFIDLTKSTDARAEELQRRIVLSRYLMRVNGAGDFPAQESGLVNNGWRGKFHAEMFWWHLAHWLLWGNEDYFTQAQPYQRFLKSSIFRARVRQGWEAGARWGKMSDPSGRSSPGEINNLLIWQQPHPLVFAEYLYRSNPTKKILHEWRDVVYETADWMAAFAWWNTTTERYDLGPPIHLVSEDTKPNATINPSFELSYWHIGLDIASRWMTRLGEGVPEKWTHVKSNLAPLPVADGLYQVYEGIKADFWTDEAYINDHPALAGLFGWLPPTEKLDLVVAEATTRKVWTAWNLTSCWGWNFPLLAMSAARLGDSEQAIDWLLHPLFGFDEVGMPTGGVRVATPYFPGSGGLLLAVAFMAAGWDGAAMGNAPGFPRDGWSVVSEGLRKAL